MEEIKNKMKQKIDEFDGDIQDIVLIIVTPEWEVDATWTNLSRSSMKNVLSAVDRAIR